MQHILLNPQLNILNNKLEFSLQDLEKEVSNFKPYIIKDVLLLSPGEWNYKLFSKESIINGYYKTDWSNKENYALIYSHDEKAENWVGNVINRRITEEGKLYGDLEIYDKDLAIKLGKGKAKLGISAKVFGDINGEEFIIDYFKNFSVVYDPACKEAYINLSEGGVVSSETSMGGEIVNGFTNHKIDYNKDEEDKKLNSIQVKKEDKKEMENKVNEVETIKNVTTEELNSKISQLLDKLEELSLKVNKLEELSLKVNKLEELSLKVNKLEEESEKEEDFVEEEAKEDVEELTKKLNEANKKIAELSLKENEPKSQTIFELSRKNLGPGSKNLSDFEINLLKTLEKIK